MALVQRVCECPDCCSCLLSKGKGTWLKQNHSAFLKTKKKLIYFNELKNLKELLLHSMYVLDRKQVLLGMPSGTVVGVGSVITVPHSLLLAGVDQPGQSIVFFICCECGDGMLGKVYL